MKIGFLGAGCWGFSLATLLASKPGYQVMSWTMDKEVIATLNRGEPHPYLKDCAPRPNMKFTNDIEDVLYGVDLLVESVTSSGVRPVFEQVKQKGIPNCPIVLTSKGIEQNTGLILPEVIIQVLGQQYKPRIGEISGPGYAQEVAQNIPTSVVASAYEYDVMMLIQEAFTTPTFRVYPNSDMVGVAYGGALKNIIAIACGMVEGLNLGVSSKAALMTRGLHEMTKLAMAKGAKLETMYGLAGMGDLVLTCSSMMSRNNRFGYLLAKGYTPDEAKKEVKTAVEGAYTCVSALQLAKELHISMPVTEAVNAIIKGKLSPKEAVELLMQREIKEEHL